MEVMVAIIVLMIGMMSTAVLMTNVYRSTVRSRYMAQATQLASEELEDLSRYPASASYTDPHISVPAGSTACGITGETCVGSLTADTGPTTFTDSSGNNTYVSYFDSVLLSVQSGFSTGNGVLNETYQMTCTGGNYLTLAFSPNGQTPSPTCSATAPAGLTYKRRWVIEANQPVSGVRRVTVWVQLKDLTIQSTTAAGAGTTPASAVTFQMSAVRP